MKKHTLYSVELYDTEIILDQDSKESVVKESHDLKEMQKGKLHSNQGGFQSEYDVFENLETSLGKLCAVIKRKAEQVMGAEELCMVSAWVNVNEYGNWNLPHNHYPRDYVAVYFVQSDLEPEMIVSNKDGHIILLDPVPDLHTHGRMKSLCSMAPKEGRLLIFPGYVMHMVAPHFSKKPRISIAVNLDVPK